MNLKPKIPADTPAPGESSSSAVDGFVAVAPAPSSAPASGTPSANAKRMTYHTTLSNALASLDLNAEVKYDLRDEDLKDLHELGQGNGGSVKKVEHVPSRTIMAKKVCLSLPARVAYLASTSSGRSSSLTQNPPSGSKSCANY
jgi:mitogen-activated protein kinase kinase